MEGSLRPRYGSLGQKEDKHCPSGIREQFFVDYLCTRTRTLVPWTLWSCIILCTSVQLDVLGTVYERHPTVTALKLDEAQKYLLFAPGSDVGMSATDWSASYLLMFLPRFLVSSPMFFPLRNPKLTIGSIINPRTSSL